MFTFTLPLRPATSTGNNAQGTSAPPPPSPALGPAPSPVDAGTSSSAGVAETPESAVPSAGQQVAAVTSLHTSAMTGCRAVCEQPAMVVELVFWDRKEAVKFVGKINHDHAMEGSTARAFMVDACARVAMPEEVRIAVRDYYDALFVLGRSG